MKWLMDIESGFTPGEIVIVMASEHKENTMEVWHKPRSKWPFWVYFKLENEFRYSSWFHWNMKNRLKNNSIDVRFENRYMKKSMYSFNKRTQLGILYKFKNEEDRLIFLLECSNDRS